MANPLCMISALVSVNQFTKKSDKVTNAQGFAYDLSYSASSVNVVTTAILGLVLPTDPISESVTFSDLVDVTGNPGDVTDIEQGCC